MRRAVSLFTLKVRFIDIDIISGNNSLFFLVVDCIHKVWMDRLVLFYIHFRWCAYWIGCLYCYLIIAIKEWDHGCNYFAKSVVTSCAFTIFNIFWYDVYYYSGYNGKESKYKYCCVIYFIFVLLRIHLLCFGYDIINLTFWLGERKHNCLNDWYHNISFANSCQKQSPYI